MVHMLIQSIHVFIVCELITVSMSTLLTLLCKKCNVFNATHVCWYSWYEYLYLFIVLLSRVITEISYQEFMWLQQRHITPPMVTDRMYDWKHIVKRPVMSQNQHWKLYMRQKRCTWLICSMIPNYWLYMPDASHHINPNLSFFGMVGTQFPYL